MAASCRYCLTTLVLLATSPAVAQQQDASGEHLVGCYSVDVADGQDLPLNYTSPPRLVRLDLLRDVRTGAEYSYVASAMYDGPHFLGLDRSWTVKNAYTVEVNWNSAFWGVQVRFPARRRVVPGWVALGRISAEMSSLLSRLNPSGVRRLSGSRNGLRRSSPGSMLRSRTKNL
jgi:hypothetical protein